MQAAERAALSNAARLAPTCVALWAKNGSPSQPISQWRPSILVGGDFLSLPLPARPGRAGHARGDGDDGKEGEPHDGSSMWGQRFGGAPDRGGRAAAKRRLDASAAMDRRWAIPYRRRMTRTLFTHPGQALRLGIVMGLVAGGWAPNASDADAAEQPNVVLILVDDQGYYDLGCYGATEVRTPRIDALAGQGLRLTDYYAAAPICSPSRAGLLTGCYPRRVGNATWVHRPDSPSGLHPDERTLAELFHENGYATACVGKWHLGFHEPFLPRNQGFDHYYGLLHNLDRYEAVHFEEAGGVPLLRNGEVVARPADPATLTRLYTDEAIDWIERRTAERDGQPFFLYLPHTMLHNPLGVGEAFRGRSGWGEYGDAIEELDHHTGRLLDALDRLGIADETVVVFTSDNGRGPGRTPEQPIRGRKLSTLEGGIRVPAIVRGPGVPAGRTSDAVIHAMDWYPTLATLAGIEVPADRVIDGRDVSPLLLGESDAVPAAAASEALNGRVPLRRRWEPSAEWAADVPRNQYLDAFFYHGSQGALAAVRWRDWKLTLHPAPQLFNLRTDPGETEPVRDGEVLRKLRGMAVLFQEEMRLDARPAGRVEVRPADAGARLPRSLTDDLHVERDVTYVRRGDRTLEMDLFRPKDAWGARPAIVCVHGGGWANGSRANHAPLAQALAARGYVTATISYRLSGEAPFPAAIHDCKAAVRFLRANAGRYGIDPDRIGAIGLSAGGHLAALLATSGEDGELAGADGLAGHSDAIQVAVAMGAQTDLLSERVAAVSADEKRGGIWRQFLGGSQAEARGRYRLASPLERLDADDPPVLFITGERDDPSTRADRFRARAAELGIETDLVVLDGAPHPFLGRQGWFDEAVDAADQFFRRAFDEPDGPTEATRPRSPHSPSSSAELPE
ncbi:Acetyl esterase [Planctomycetes bacterium LzC2]|uniref:Acetyl esterase n=1 Tax=Alienimonas chondri TaxID=2681879 RepID=A0ABX1V9P8_9PLAN|nr:Acetyl esterase [Alienimonas chondri]